MTGKWLPSNVMPVNQIDHVEVEVPDRYEAARWYQTVLGFESLSELEEKIF